MSQVLPSGMQPIAAPNGPRGAPFARTLLPRFALSVAMGVGLLWGWMAVQGPPGGQPPNPFSNQPPNPFAQQPPAPPQPAVPFQQQPQPPPPQAYRQPVRTGGGGGGSSLCGTFCAACAGEMCGEAICCGCESAVSICASTTPMTLATAPGMLWRSARLIARPEAMGAVGALLFPMMLLALWRRREVKLES
ncbi:MAG: hypothetical protein U0165_04575 [Polyangiaceae bacterium]